MCEELTRQLHRQLKYLEKSSREYDNGDLDEALRIAVALRVLFHDTEKSTSLLTLLNQKQQLYIISTLQTIEEQRKEYLQKYGMIITSYNPPIMYVNGERRPPLDSWGIKKFLTAESWWKEKILKINDEEYSRKDIVTLAANKDGGAHVELKLNNKTKLLKNGTGRVEYRTGSEKMNNELLDNHFLFLRQFAHEVLSSKIS